MCGRKLKESLLLLGLCSLLCFSPLCSYCYADVTLTDKEAQELMTEIQESKKDLTELKSQLNEAETQLSDVKNTYEEQKKSYETQLSEVSKQNKGLKTGVTITTTSSIILFLLTILFIFI